MEVDIITFDLSKRLPFRLKPALLQTAVKRGVHLEICYAAAIRDEGLRRSCFANALGKSLLVPSLALLFDSMALESWAPSGELRVHCARQTLPGCLALHRALPLRRTHDIQVTCEMAAWLRCWQCHKRC